MILVSSPHQPGSISPSLNLYLEYPENNPCLFSTSRPGVGVLISISIPGVSLESSFSPLHIVPRSMSPSVYIYTWSILGIILVSSPHRTHECESNIALINVVPDLGCPPSHQGSTKYKSMMQEELSKFRN